MPPFRQGRQRFSGGAVGIGRRDTWVPPYNRFCRARVSCRECGKTRSGRCGHRPLRRGYKGCSARSVGGQRRPPLRKRNKRCNGRATARVAPTGALQGVRRGERNPPVTASPCQPPLGKGALGTGGYGLPQPVCALASQ